MNTQNLLPPTEKSLTRTEVGEKANEWARAQVFADYLSRKTRNTLLTQRMALNSLAFFLGDARQGEALATHPEAWQGMSWGIVTGFGQWMLQEGYSTNTVNNRLSVVKTYARLAAKAGTLSADALTLIQTVSGYRREEAANLDTQRTQTRKGFKKEASTSLNGEQVKALQRQLGNGRSPQQQRDLLLLCLFAEHGLRVGELLGLRVGNVHLAEGTLTFYRPKTKKTTTHRLTAETRAALVAYLQHHPAQTEATASLLLTTSRLHKDGSNGRLQPTAMSYRALQKRAEHFGRQMGLVTVSAHDFRHYCATDMARKGYELKRLMDWFGWTSPAMAMRYVESTTIQERDKG